MALDLKTKETELATMVNQAKTLYAELEAKGEASVTGEDRTKLENLIAEGKRKREELDSLKVLNDNIEYTSAPDGERKVKDAIDLISGKSGGAFKSWGDIVLASEQLKAVRASNSEKMDRVNVGTIQTKHSVKALYSGATTSGGVLSDNQFNPEILDIARQRPLTVLDLINHSQTTSDAVEYLVMDTRNGGVVSVTITAQGSGYTSSSTVTFGAAPAGGVTATGVPIVVAGAITGVTITNPGSGYVSAPSVTFAVAGSGATGTAVLGGPGVVGEYASGLFGLKPEAGMTFALNTANVKTIATWIAISKQILDDVPRLRALVDNELTYMVEVFLEDQILTGNGSGSNFTGIINTSGIQSRVHKTSGRGFVSTDNNMDTIRRMLTDLRLAFYAPDGIVLNPANAETMELTKASTAGTYLGVYDPVAARVWRVPVIETAAMTAGTALAGQFRIGATLWDRMQTQIFTGQPNDFFLRNAFAILAELRAAFAVTRPLAFEKATGMD